MFIRLALKEDVSSIVDMARANCDETCADEDFDAGMVHATFARYLETANPTFFVVEDHRQVIGFLQCYMFGYDYRAGLYTVQKVLYVKPEKRGTRAAVLLIKHLIQWSQQLGADRIEGGNDNSFQSERTAKFLSHFGFETVGFAMRKKLEEQSHGR
ncbi:GNAT family N-acetyltransferase [Hoeflea sp. G2-23]|uniref:GNAT family N-acetyltransferase n=1 Tax=Hoeflea algicola TaxID=2983763 RepID=A0ABT3Z986_9HYPH|nr:GNAT family N-acetyltransferase [Hoeflea algicola]MCY0148307.1 GNAT family N-acetyltransferase [Hoeflea algicola]